MSKKEQTAKKTNNDPKAGNGAAVDEVDDIQTEQPTENPEQAQNPESDMEKELAQANDKYLRVSAEYQNFRRRTESERSEIAAFANERIAKELLEVMDNFERALANASQGDGFVDGVRLIYKQLSDVLTNFQVIEIKAEGEDFDPNFHHGVLQEEVEGVESGKVIAVMQKGYELNGRVIRAAMVKVSV